MFGRSERTINPNLLPRYLLCAYTLRWTLHTCSISIPCCLFFFRYAKCLETNTIHTLQRDGLIFHRLVLPDKHGIICYLCCRNRWRLCSEETRSSRCWGGCSTPSDKLMDYGPDSVSASDRPSEMPAKRQHQGKPSSKCERVCNVQPKQIAWLF